jgi:sugar O-acyltransferase (sialic acid O-acetyltransferase NeuD family)
MASIVLVGGGGHARVVLDAVRSRGEHDVVGIVDSQEMVGTDVDGVSVRWTDADLPRLRAEGINGCVIAIGSVGDPAARIHTAVLAREAGLPLVTVTHAAAVVSPSAVLGAGTFVAAGAIVGPGADTGTCVIVNSGAVVDHDCRLGAFVHVAPGAVLSGEVTVGERSHIGTGATVKQGVTIGADTVVGVGSVVVDDLPVGVVAYGQPCRPVRASGR